VTRDATDAGASLLRHGPDQRRRDEALPSGPVLPGTALPDTALPDTALPDTVLPGTVPATRTAAENVEAVLPDCVQPGSVLTAKAAAENFPVALRLLPARYRQHLMAVYGFARTADDIGDRAPARDRLALLAELETDLRRLYRDQRASRPAAVVDAATADTAVNDAEANDAEGTGGAGDGGPRLPAVRLPAVRALGPAVAQCAIPMQPFLDLIEANRQDQVVSRYRTFDDLLGYCRLSANPVGRIVLHVFGCFSPRRAELSDSVCTALQLAEHWQDVAEDFRAGRVYLPLDDMAEHGCTEQDLAAAAAPPRLRELIAFEVGRARALLDAGAPLIGTLRGAPRAAVAGYVAGGRATLAAIAAADHDVLAATRRPGTARTAAELLLALARGR
jgi:squalene synthase HpnC